MTIDVGAEMMRVFLFLFAPFPLVIFFLQWHWAKICDASINVLIAQQAGSGKFQLSPKEGNVVFVTNPATKEVRGWPISELATITVPYPGIGFIPKFLQKSIQLAIVNEGDWEPMLNRSPHRKGIASPDIVDFLRSLKANDRIPPGVRKDIDKILGYVSTGPTREMIADPSVFGNLMRSTVLKALAAVGDDLMDALKGMTAQLTRLAGLNPTIIYVGLGLTVILQAFIVYNLVQLAPGLEQAAELTAKVNAIAKALGVK